MLLVMANDVTVYYLRGRLYLDLMGRYINRHASTPVVSKLKMDLSECFVYQGELTFGDFIEKYGQSIKDSVLSVATFLSQDDYFRLISAMKKLECKQVRILMESSAVADFLASHLEDVDVDDEREIVYSLHYDGTDTGFLFGDGVAEIMIDHEDLRKCESRFVQGKRFVIRDVDNLAAALLGGMTRFHYRKTGRDKDTLLLEAVPFDIGFGTKWNSPVPVLIESGTTISARKSETFDFVGTDHVGVSVYGRIHLIDVAAAFGYAPRQIVCTVECGASLQDITFTIQDKENKKEVEYTMDDIHPLLG